MTFIEILVMAVVCICCTGGIGWLFYDIKKQIEAYSEAYNAEQESTLGLVEDDEE